MATTSWYTISQLNNASSGTFNSKNGYKGNSSTSWYWGKYSSGARGGYFGRGKINTNIGEQHAVLVFWVPFPTVAVGSTKKVTKIEVQMYQNMCSGIQSGRELRAYACKGGPSGTNDTPANWLNGTGGVTGVFASDRSVKTGNYTGSTPATYTFSNTSGFAANTSGCFICFTGNDNQQNLTECTMQPTTYPQFKFTYTDSSSTPTNYTITYYRNFSTSDNTTKSGGTVASGNYYVLDDCHWTRQGYSFNGWVASRSSSVIYNPGAEVQAFKNQTWYATWQENTPSTVTFTFDPGSYSDGSKVSYSRSYNYSTREVSLPSGSSNYFTGTTITHDKEWYYLTCNCGNGSFSNGVSVAQVSNDFTQKQTQYVQTAWQLDDTVNSEDPFNSYIPNQNVTFYPYWGNTSNSWIYNVTLNIPSEKPTRSGYSFVEWNTSSSGRGDSYQPGGSIRQLKTDGNFSNKTLYAIWEASEFKITFSPGNYGRGSSEQLTTTNGQLTTLPSNYFTRQAGTTYYFNYYLQGGTMSTPPGFSVDTSATYGPHYQTSNKTTYYHNYWNTDPNGSPKNNMGVDCWSCGATYSFTSDMTIYPEWGSSVPKYTLPTPTKVGYKFVAWNTNASGTGTNYAAGTEFALRSNKTFYAIWEPEWTIKINNGTTWGDYHVWIYTGATSNNGWQQAIPYVYDGSNWKLTKI